MWTAPSNGEKRDDPHGILIGRYLSWTGLTTKVFNVGEYRREATQDYRLFLNIALWRKQCIELGNLNFFKVIGLRLLIFGRNLMMNCKYFANMNFFLQTNKNRAGISYLKFFMKPNHMNPEKNILKWFFRYFSPTLWNAIWNLHFFHRLEYLMWCVFNSSLKFIHILPADCLKLGLL